MNKQYILIQIPFFLLCGCTTFHTPSSLIGAQIPNTSLSHIVLGVDTPHNLSLDEEKKYYYWADGLISSLNKAKLFKTVNYTNQLSESPNLTVEVFPKQLNFHCMTGEASLMVMTLGLIPLDLSREIQYDFELKNPITQKSIEFHISKKQAGYMGSLICLLNLSPSWSSRQDDEHLIDMFSNDILLKQDKIFEILSTN